MPKGVYQHRPRKTIEEKLYLQIDYTDTCWLWNGPVNEHGYGRVYHGRGGAKYAHRVSWELFNGVIDTSLCVLHKCDTPRCVNPLHLFLGTRRDNVLDMDAKGRRVFRTRTHCAKGHPFDEKNTGYPQSPAAQPQIWCRACKREANHKRRSHVSG